MDLLELGWRVGGGCSRAKQSTRRDRKQPPPTTTHNHPTTTPPHPTPTHPNQTPGLWVPYFSNQCRNSPWDVGGWDIQTLQHHGRNSPGSDIGIYPVCGDVWRCGSLEVTWAPMTWGFFGFFHLFPACNSWFQPSTLFTRATRAFGRRMGERMEKHPSEHQSHRARPADPRGSSIPVGVVSDPGVFDLASTDTVTRSHVSTGIK